MRLSHRRAHLLVWSVLSILLPALLLTAWGLRSRDAGPATSTMIAPP
jgi:hypothetical protein